MNGICFSVQRLCCRNDPTVGIDIEISLQVCVSIYWVPGWKMKPNFWCMDNCSLLKCFIDFTLRWKSFRYVPVSSRFLIFFPSFWSNISWFSRKKEKAWYKSHLVQQNILHRRRLALVLQFHNTLLSEVTGISFFLFFYSEGSCSFIFRWFSSWTQPNVE